MRTSKPCAPRSVRRPCVTYASSCSATARQPLRLNSAKACRWWLGSSSAAFASSQPGLRLSPFWMSASRLRRHSSGRTRAQRRSLCCGRLLKVAGACRQLWSSSGAAFCRGSTTSPTCCLMSLRGASEKPRRPLATRAAPCFCSKALCVLCRPLSRALATSCLRSWDASCRSAQARRRPGGRCCRRKSGGKWLRVSRTGCCCPPCKGLFPNRRSTWRRCSSIQAPTQLPHWSPNS
mmetsp:Transcript_54797/g.152909  ORF Transcript_54797/g.152909 Transcript_54797/m.152909 type:complete len:235 (+) Transcript_54797:630-1334(+)